jgi:hypothetical protein
MLRKFWLLVPILLTPLQAQQPADQEKQLLQEVLRRLDTLEQQNRELLAEVKELKQAQTQMESSAEPPLAEQVKVNETRIAEQAQTKVESSQKLPVTLYGTLLFNAFSNSKNVTNELGPYSLLTGPGRSGATVRQTILGFDFQGPALPGGGHVEATLATDFWAGSAVPSANWLRIRRAGITLDWMNTDVFVGQDKPLISPYQPDSLAEVGVPAMSGAANGMDAQVAALQVGSYLGSSTFSPSPAIYSGGVRPALEARLAFWHKSGETKKFELAPGFHVSSSHFNGVDLITKIGSVDWLYTVLPKLEWKGTGYYGQNVASLGSLGNGFYQNYGSAVQPVVSAGGWTQLSVPVNNRLTLNVFGGLENDQAGATSGAGIARSSSFAGNAMFHLSPNVVLSFEAQRLWTRTFSGQPNTYNHYDLALAYLF